MICKYCYKRNHEIDKCPTIICKICNKVGHPKWQCEEGKLKKGIINKEETKKNNVNSIEEYLKRKDDKWREYINKDKIII